MQTLALVELVELAQRDPRLSATSGSLLAFLVTSELLTTSAPRPLKVRALAVALKRYDRTVAWCLNQLVATGYLTVHGRDGSARCFTLAGSVPPGARDAVRDLARAA